VTALYVFGSVAKGNAGPASDVDVMIDYDPESGFNLFDLSGIHLRPSERLGVSVDVVTRDGIHRRIRDRALKEAVRVPLMTEERAPLALYHILDSGWPPK
jgi:predicted nucleotidyltransferase